MNKKESFKIVDITGKKKIKCPRCGLESNIPPRTLSKETLKHMQEVKDFVEWSKRATQGQGMGNVRLAMCPRCKQVMICTDKFSVDV